MCVMEPTHDAELADANDTLEDAMFLFDDDDRPARLDDDDNLFDEPVYGDELDYDAFGSCLD